MSADRMKHSDNARKGWPLSIGAMWEIETQQSLRDLYVYAGELGIRIVNMFCGEKEMAERAAVHLSVDEAEALAEVLAAAVESARWNSEGVWKNNAVRADPYAWLGGLMEERCRKLDRELAAEREADYCTCDTRSPSDPPCELHAPTRYSK
jgi:hypothetical protein